MCPHSTRPTCNSILLLRRSESITKAAEGKAAALLKEAAQAQKESDKLAK